MNTLIAPPPMSDVNALVTLMNLVADPAAINAKLQELQEVSAQIYANLVTQATNTDAQTAKDVALNEKEVSLGQREAAIAQREAALSDAETAMAAKLAALRAITG